MLRADNITKSYNDQKIFSHISLDLKKGDRMIMMGASGSGKTSLIYILAGLDSKFTGSVQQSTKKTSVVFQDAGLFTHKTVKENIIYPSRKIGDDESYQQWLEVCDLKDVVDSYPFQLSRGMKQKVAIIRGFISQPELIFLDEPFSALDNPMTEKILSHISEYYSNTTILIASHTKISAVFCPNIFELS